MEELSHFNKLAVGRELQMYELKKEVDVHRNKGTKTFMDKNIT